MADQDRDPDVDRVERAELLKDEADTERHDDLRRDGNIERALRVTGALQTAGVRQRNRDKHPRYAEDPQQLHADFDDRRIAHPEDRQELARDEQKEQPDHGRAADAVPRGDVYGLIRAFRVTRAEVLAGNGRGRSHETDRGPGDE